MLVGTRHRHWFALILALCVLLVGGAVTPASALVAPAQQPLDINTPLAIPSIAFTPTLDGSCKDYSNLTSYPILDNTGGSTGFVYLAHNGPTLYVCLETRGSQFGDTFGAVYLDKGAKRASFATDSDFSLKVRHSSGVNESFHGTGIANGYVSPGPSGWTGVTNPPTSAPETYEYSIPADIFGGACGDIFGIAAYHMWVTGVGDDHGWPSNQFFDQPKTWQLAKLDGLSCNSSDRLKGKIAYVFRNNTADAASFKALLDAQGPSLITTLVPLATVVTTDFSQFDLIIIADDTGDLSDWGLGAAADKAAQVLQITRPNKPLIGVGEGGYAFFGKLSLFIGWPHGWHGPNLKVLPTAELPSYYTTPNNVPGSPVQLYGTAVNEVGIFLEQRPVPVTAFGLELADKDHAPLIAQGCRQLWGFSAAPSVMTGDGKNLYINAVAYGLASRCQGEPTPPTQTECKLTLTKTASPTGTVHPGDTILYTLTYTLTGFNTEGLQPGCRAYRAQLIDPLPADTLFVPGSASDGIAPAPDKVLTWDLGLLEPDATTHIVSGSKQFKVVVSEVQCLHQHLVINQAKLTSATLATVVSNQVSNKVDCPPVGFPNEKPPYAQDEIQIHPYPLTTNQPSDVSVRVSNNSSVAQILTVHFQVSPDHYGIGMAFGDFFTKTVIVPAMSNLIVHGGFTPVTPGHYCMQVKVEGKDVNGTVFQPIYTQRNLDVSEDFTDGQDDMVFKVHNDSAVAESMILVVDNTCPGWTATLDQNPVALAPGQTKDVTLHVVAPSPVVLGSGCHIDVQGWVDGKLIGGVRKLDVPPVGLPHDVVPSWLEPEISVTPNPPVVGQPTKLCVELQNPLPYTRTVTVVFSVADYGAVMPFVDVATKTFTLPANSPPSKYCADWTPTTGGSLHRCARVTLKQDGYKDQVSQRNLQLVRVNPGDSPNGRGVTFKVGNPNAVVATLAFDITKFGIAPVWNPVIEEVLGDGSVRPAPATIGPNEVHQFRITLQPAAGQARAWGRAALQEQQDSFFGDESLVDVAVSLNGESISGFSVGFAPPDQQAGTTLIYLPIVRR